MSDHMNELRATLARLQEQLHGAEDISEETTAKLHQTLADIQRLLEHGPLAQADRSTEGPLQSIVDRLSEAEQEFQATHPTLSGIVGSTIDALGRMGI